MQIELHKASPSIEVPVLKAWNRIFELVKCVDENPYNRGSLRDAVLALYPDRSEKSVFRGMAIPTLRRLGLIIGFDDLIRLSANGKILLEGNRLSQKLGKRVLGAIVYEFDLAGIGLVSLIKKHSPSEENDILKAIFPRMAAPNQSSKKERAKDWLNLLAYCGLINKDGSLRSINLATLKMTTSDIDSRKKRGLFGEYLYPSYHRLVIASKGMQSQPIADLRQEVALVMLRRQRRILTEKQFDELLLAYPKTRSNYRISFGRSMGADEKLFLFDGSYYQTISIQHN